MVARGAAFGRIFDVRDELVLPPISARYFAPREHGVGECFVSRGVGKARAGCRFPVHPWKSGTGEPRRTGAKPFYIAPEPFSTGAKPFCIAPEPLSTGANPFCMAPEPLGTGASPFCTAPEPLSTGASPFCIAPEPFSTGAKWLRNRPKSPGIRPSAREWPFGAGKCGFFKSPAFMAA